MTERNTHGRGRGRWHAIVTRSRATVRRAGRWVRGGLRRRRGEIATNVVSGVAAGVGLAVVLGFAAFFMRLLD